MQTIDAIYTGGKFEPLTPVNLQENERVQITVQVPDSAVEARIAAARQWFAEAAEFRERLHAKYGILPDSTPDIAADRRRDG